MLSGGGAHTGPHPRIPPSPHRPPPSAGGRSPAGANGAGTTTLLRVVELLGAHAHDRTVQLLGAGGAVEL